MKAYLKSRKGKLVAWLTIIVIAIGGLGIWKYLDNAHNNALIHAQVTAPVTSKQMAAALKEGPIHQFTDGDLVKYRKQAYRQRLDRSPNGYLEIPSIDVRLPIYNRANNATLSLGVGKDYYLDSQMGQGNFVVAGHNMERRHVLLSDLSQVKIGDTITLEGANHQQYRYHVTSKKVVAPYVKLVNNQPVAGSAYYLPRDNERPLVTIYTCADHGRNRLVVQGELD